MCTASTFGAVLPAFLLTAWLAECECAQRWLGNFFISLILYYYFFRFTHANVYCTQPPSTGQTCFGMLVSEGMKESSSSLSSVRSHAFYAVAQNVFPKEFRHFFLSVFRFFSFLDSFFISFDLNIHNLYPHHGQNGFELLAAIVCMKCVCVRLWSGVVITCIYW